MRTWVMTAGLALLLGSLALAGGCSANSDEPKTDDQTSATPEGATDLAMQSPEPPARSLRDTAWEALNPPIGGCTSIIMGINKPILIQGKHFAVGIEQDGEPLEVRDDTVILRKAPFSIVVYFREPDGVLVNASFRPDSFAAARTGKPVNEIVGFTGTGMAENDFNLDRHLFETETAQHWWYYNSDDNHRFSTIEKLPCGIKCSRIIENICLRDEEGQPSLPVADIEPDSLYLVFLQTVSGETKEDYVERQRAQIALRFRDF